MKGNNLTIAIGNQKGGVGKTTSTACIGAALALQGRRVLLVTIPSAPYFIKPSLFRTLQLKTTKSSKNV